MAKSDEKNITSDNCKMCRVTINVLPVCELGALIRLKIFDGAKLVAWVNHIVNENDIKIEKNDDYKKPFLTFQSGDMKKRDFTYKHNSDTDDYNIKVVSE